MRKLKSEGVLTISTAAEARELERKVRSSAARATTQLAAIPQESTGLHGIRKLKFDQVGCDPLNEDRSLNLIEQVNQSFTYLVSLRAAEYLIEHHPAAAPFYLNIGARPGPDIYSADMTVVAETFAAVTPNNNDKLKKDIKRVKESSAQHKYVFYASAQPGIPRTDPDVHLVVFTLAELLGEPGTVSIS